MDITPLTAKGAHTIQGYGNGGFKINQTPLKGNLIISPLQVFSWQTTSVEMATLASLAPVTHAVPGVEILLVGCGKRSAAFPVELRQALKSQGIAVEVMDTGAACRTYNVLLSEGRNVAAAVIAVE